MVTYNKILQEMRNDHKEDGSTFKEYYTVDEIFDYLKKKKLVKKKRLIKLIE